ncbi:hypothetical protein ANO14919_038000 [Xylariales sp. No.14919]|nr:hypothetical protein ANO14919_038000 [Xylariales sp. No.14919]
MKLFTVAALVATALAASTSLDSRGAQCTPPSYTCKADASGWLVCNVDGTWLDGGSCPKNTKCKPINNLPYCV